MDNRKAWAVDLLVGVLLGGISGAIAAVNIVIFSGMERGYESTIPEIFRQNVLVGIMTVVTLAAGPLVGVWLMRRRRQRAIPATFSGQGK
jgi:hypothetical protein